MLKKKHNARRVLSEALNTVQLRLLVPDSNFITTPDEEEPPAAPIDGYVQDFKRVEEIPRNINLLEQTPSQKSISLRKRKQVSIAKSTKSKLSDFERTARKSVFQRQ
mmetsp:Transcript_12120/g.8826  ORF Transcript_12120/g.8826 Transcript_12120/m.8826 type:complete len:107 (+) Transcript_12120:3-323(+)